MAQSKKMSFVESWSNILIGYWVNFFANMIILPMFGFNLTLKKNFVIGILYTFVSLLRSYCIRRFFNRLEVK